MRFLVPGVGLLVVVLLVIAIIDVVSRPTPNPETCALDVQILLPDTCAGDCEPGSICLPLTTRPYAIFFTQAATCVDLCSIDVR